MSYFGSAVLLDEAARTDIMCTLTRDWFYRRALHTGGYRDLRFILIAAQKNYVLNAPLDDRPIAGADADVMNV